MPHRSRPNLGTSLVLLALLPSCASLDSRATETPFHRLVALPADVTAAIVAGAVRTTLPFGDPVTLGPGAPATADGHTFCIVYEQDRAGHWLPRAGHRLRLVAPETSAEPVVVMADARPHDCSLTGFGARAIHRVRLRVEPVTGATLVHGELPAPVAAELAAAIERGLTIATDPLQALLGLDERNLATWVRHRLWQLADAARNAGNDHRARELLQRALLLPEPPGRLIASLAELTALGGDTAAARTLCLHALATTEEPCLRSQLASQLAAWTTVASQPSRLRAAAADRLAQQDLAGAESLLHTARRSHPRPDRDYQLMSDLHRQRHDELATAACELLAREHSFPDAGGPAANGEVRSAEPEVADARRAATSPTVAAGDGWRPRRPHGEAPTLARLFASFRPMLATAFKHAGEPEPAAAPSR